MPNRNLQELPKFEDNWSHLYFEKGRIDQFQKSIGFHYLDKIVPIPIETIGLLLLGPGTSITHEAIKRISDSRCLLAWTGEGGVRFYSAGYTGTYSARNLLRQVVAYGDPKERDFVIRRMYQFRFSDEIPADATIEQIRGLEGARVRKIYREWSENSGVPWKSRSYDQNSWDWSDPINRALSSANACLYGVVHAAILQSGFSPAIGFVHTGKQLSFVYDIADLYKAEITIPLAFEVTAEDATNVERRVRFACRDKFKHSKLLKRIIPDIKELIYGGSDFGESEDFSEGRDVAVSH
ncbi:type I-E CRISPR-associated endonuclease Cas1e [Leptospira santarosai]|uniref:CRISPR-associated endonuclease Cas1 n=1 Tax=Leptospira santarosai serovar Shermani str. LT 821 TaxID=758847 RepID=K8XWB2_9LEPT|nr:type I-E CRISPR-associated endonuclease Cas1e [Leptospira santarosai]EKT85833.1 CRISPR-associated protein Cas1 [Leptospira santarosai serovar Shermani str. LT 821]EMO83206.1 CRISPR-associated endonuclease Cas1, subtype TIGR03638 [Leptospira santarosai str. AIM]EPG81715.1 CRISPR-associated endonuclease Cas1, subtype TIGR03638 [Leptospira santarosai serovar Shermani str. 1342KT]